MFVSRTKLGLLKTVVEWMTLGFIVGSIFLAIEQPLFYILVAFCVLLFLIATNKSNYVILKKDGLVYKKYWIWKKIKFDAIKVLFITKHSYMTRTGVADFHDKNTKQTSGCIFLMKDISLSAKESLVNSVQMYGEWNNICIDIQYKSEIFEKVLAGGFDGDIFITNELNNSLGKEINGTLKKMNSFAPNIRVL